MEIATARIYVGSGLDQPGAEGAYARHRTVIDPREILPAVEEIVSRRHEGATITKGRGRWRGRGEPSLVVEIWDRASQSDHFFREAADTAREIVDALDQVQVALVTTHGGKTSVAYLGRRAERARKHGRRFR